MTGEGRPLLRYALALGSVAAAVGVHMLLQPLFGSKHPYVMFCIASLLSAWFGGIGPGMLAATLGAFAASYLFVPPLHSLSIASAEDLVGLLSYTFVAFTGSLLIDGQRRARQSALRSAAVAQDRLEQLERETLERSAAQHKLEQTQQQFALFMRHLPGAAWIKDVQGRYMYANETAERIFCRTLAELHNKTDDEIFPLETAREFKANDQIALQSGQRHQAVETLKQEDGLHFSIVNKFPIFGADGSPVMVGGM